MGVANSWLGKICIVVLPMPPSYIHLIRKPLLSPVCTCNFAPSASPSTDSTTRDKGFGVRMECKRKACHEIKRFQENFPG